MIMPINYWLDAYLPKAIGHKMSRWELGLLNQIFTADKSYYPVFLGLPNYPTAVGPH